MVNNGILKMGDVRILDIGKTCGQMSISSVYYPRLWKANDRQKDFLKRRIELGNKHLFDGRKVFFANQSNKDGSYLVINKDIVDSIYDGWFLDILEDILIVTKDTPGVVIASSVSDYPVIIMNDVNRGVIALACCGIDAINRELPISIFKALEKEYGTKSKDVRVYISSCIGKFNLENFSSVMSNKEVWEESISEGLVDCRSAIKKQLRKIDIPNSNMFFNMDSTYLDDNYYSSYGAKFDKSKRGKNLVGAYYPLEKVKTFK